MPQTRKQNLLKKHDDIITAIETLADKAESEGRDFDADEQKTYDAYKQDLEVLKGQIARENEIEEISKSRAVPVDSSPASQIQRVAFGMGGRAEPRQLKAKLFVDMARAIYHGGGSTVAAMRMAEHMGLKEAAAVFKAVVDPADTTTATWAAELMRDGYGAFIALLRPKSVYARAPAMDAILGRNGKLLFPGMTTGVAGGWVGEGRPIPMAQGVLNEQELIPYKLGVITGLTRELLERSDPAADVIIRDSMVRDTAIVLDTTFVSADAAVTGISPAGIRNGVTPVDATPAGATNTIEELDAAFAAAISACLAADMDDDLYWLISPITKLKLRNRSTATGTYPYRAELDAGTLSGYPVLDSNTIAEGTIILVHGSSLYKLIEGDIMIALSTDATVHTNTAPEQIVSGGGTPTIPAEGNVRSAFQEDSVFMRVVLPASWGIMRQGAVQVIENYVI